MKEIVVSKTDKVLKATIRLPASKSISNRLLILRALIDRDFKINNLSTAEDSLLLGSLLEKIMAQKGPGQLVELDTHNAGSVMRFLTAFLALRPGKWVITGDERMRKRPIGVLVDGLKPLGANIDYLAKLGYPPILIKGTTLKGREVVIDPGISSQFVSALIMIGPTLPGGLTLHMAGHPVSQPYIDMTIRIMKSFGVNIIRERSYISIPETIPEPHDFTVEPDWSAAAFWYEAAALADDVDLFLPGLTEESLQGDSVLAVIFENLGVHSEFSKEGVRLTRKPLELNNFAFSFSDHPDIASTVITTCAALGMEGKFDGLKSLMIKESDRLQALRNELPKLNIHPDAETPDAANPKIEFSPGLMHASGEISIETYGDHRIAMTFAPLALKLGSITIKDPDVVIKSYPQYWEDMQLAGFKLL
ncbi:MAG TPA: hypothetical protein VLR52_00220 [Bacteroidales bacterium]|nr:hypothetical protein [Bacteroidales bacterium]